MAAKLKTGPVGYPVTLAEAKAQCRVDGSEEDSLINSLIAAATDHVERYTGRAILSQTWQDYFDDFSDSMALTIAPVQSVTSVQYYDAAGSLQTLSGSAYFLDTVNEPSWVVRNADVSWPDTSDRINAVIVEYVAGYATTPPAIKHAILLMVGQLYENRESPDVPRAVEALLQPFRVYA